MTEVSEARSNDVDTNESVDRRRMLKGAGLAAAAGAAALVVTGKASPAGAITNPLNIDIVNGSAADTELHHPSGAANHTGIIFLAHDTDFAASDTSFPAAIGGWAGGTKAVTGVYGYSAASSGYGVIGNGSGTNAIGVYGIGNNGGPAVQADAQGNSRSIIAQNYGNNQAIWANVVNAASSATSVRAETAGSGSGVYAVSAKGVGAKFQGKTAQIQLIPSTDASHPACGSAGQLFLDHSNRLWFCKGGTNWHQLA
jgi:hypothetical protein